VRVGAVKVRIAASVVLAAGLLLGTSGCAFFAPQSTLLHYDPSDGVGVAIGTVKVRNALLLTEDGERASLLINFINDGSKAVDLEMQVTLDGKKVTKHYHVRAGGVKTYGDTEDDQIILQGIGTKAGELYPVWFQYGDHTGKRLLLPILDGTWSTYKGLLPTPVPTIVIPTPLPTQTNIPGATLTPTPAPSASN
jgi:hypothetical protein